MSRLSEILGVGEAGKFKFKDRVFVMRGNHIAAVYSSYTAHGVGADVLCDMIAHPELIRLIPPKPSLTDQQKTAIKGRIAEGTPWAARDKDGGLWFFVNKPEYDRRIGYFKNDDADCVESYSAVYDFITHEDSPVYLPDLIEETESALKEARE